MNAVDCSRGSLQPASQPVWKLAIVVPLALGLSVVLDSIGQTISWGTAVGNTLVQSDGATVGASFNFELGTFVDGFNPRVENPSVWAANWRAFDQANTSNAKFNPDFGFVSSSSVLDENGHTTVSPFAGEPEPHDFRGSQGYIWAFNDKTPSADAEWALITDSQWKFPDNAQPNAPVLQWRLSEGDGESHEPVFGGVNNTSGPGVKTETTAFDLQTHTFVPEPSTVFLVLAGWGALLLSRPRRIDFPADFVRSPRRGGFSVTPSRRG